MFCVKNRFGENSHTRVYSSLNSREGVGKTGFMGQGTLMPKHDKSIFKDMLAQKKERYISTSHVYEIK